MPFRTASAVALGRRQQPREIDPSGHAAILRRDASDAIGLPHVGEDFPVDEFELVELRDRAVGVADGDSPGLLERRGIEEAQLRRAVAHDQPRAVVRQAPALARVRKRLDLLEGADVVEERDLGSPRELKQRPLPVGDALAEVLRVERLHLQDLPGLDLHLPDARSAVQARPLVEHAVAIDRAPA